MFITIITYPQTNNWERKIKDIINILLFNCFFYNYNEKIMHFNKMIKMIKNDFKIKFYQFLTNDFKIKSLHNG